MSWSFLVSNFGLLLLTRQKQFLLGGLLSSAPKKEYGSRTLHGGITAMDHEEPFDVTKLS